MLCPPSYLCPRDLSQPASRPPLRPPFPSGRTLPTPHPPTPAAGRFPPSGPLYACAPSLPSRPVAPSPHTPTILPFPAEFSGAFVAGPEVRGDNGEGDGG